MRKAKTTMSEPFERTGADAGEQLYLVGPAAARTAAEVRGDDQLLTAAPASAHASIGEEMLLVVLAMALAVGLWVGAGAAGQQAREQGAVALRQTVLDAAMQCFAIEGAYPQTLQYLEDGYGVAVNHDAYAVTYEAFASNVMPSVVVVPR